MLDSAFIVTFSKIIGARVEFTSGAEATARDTEGHGSHTASTAAGNTVSGANFYGLAQGNARGAVPSARIAVYMACEEFCDDHKVLAAFDDAIADGVDIITISIGKDVPFPYENDTIAIGAFHAMEKGILTVQAAGNSGPDPFTVSSHAPWIISVAASSTDRRIIDKTVLGNGQTFVVSSFNISNLCHSPSHFFQIYFVIIIYRGTLCCYCDSCPSLHLSSGT